MPAPPAPAPYTGQIHATLPPRQSAPPSHSPSSTPLYETERKTRTRSTGKIAVAPTPATKARSPSLYSGSAPTPASSPNPLALTAHTSISVHSYRKASAGNTLAADPLGYNVAIKLTPRLTAATITASQIRGANG